MSATALWRRSSPDHARLAPRILLVPLGSFEQHGPHLPLCVDALIATAICADVAEQREVDVAPVLAYGASGEHEGFAGLLSLGTEVTALVLSELVRSARSSWRAVLFVCAHGGNAQALARAVALARAEGDTVATWLASDPSGDAHAGATETSVVLSIDPSLVDPDRYPAPTHPQGDWTTRARRGGLRAVSDSGVLGDPSRASVQHGRQLRERWCAEVVTMIDEMDVLA